MLTRPTYTEHPSLTFEKMVWAFFGNCFRMQAAVGGVKRRQSEGGCVVGSEGRGGGGWGGVFSWVWGGEKVWPEF